jgi:hypothetical protein
VAHASDDVADPLLIGGADGSLILLGDDEHRWSMGRHGVTGNLQGTGNPCVNAH